MKYKGYTGHFEYDNKAKIFMEMCLELKMLLPFKAQQSLKLNKHLKTPLRIIWNSVRKEVKYQTFQTIQIQLFEQIPFAYRLKFRN